jgi:sulfur carrier protein ThiS adenylyltransferase
MNDLLQITLAERPLRVSCGTTLFGLRAAQKPEADVVVLNGAPALEDVMLREGDAVVLIRRGEVPGEDELEALMAARHTPGVHAQLKGATVGIAGAGGLGMLKVDALRENLRRINPYVRVETHAVRLTPENVPEIFGEVSVLAEAFDAADQKAMLVESFGTPFPERPLVVATGLAGHLPSNTVVTRRIGRNLIVVGDLVTAAGPGMGLMAPRVGVAAHHQANAILRILVGEDPVG